MSLNAYQTAKDLADRYDDEGGEDLISVMVKDVFPGKICLVSSFGAEAALLLDMASKVDKALPVVFIDTQKLFPETLAYRDMLIARYAFTNVKTYYPDYADTSRSDPGEDLWSRDVNACCYIRKVKPLEKALQGFDAWITGRKRFQGGTRKDMPLIESAGGRVKINPLANWDRNDVAKAFKERDIPLHPLKEHGYLSIGCMPCTSIPDDPDDPRSGRWQGQEKTECGIHLDEDGKLVRSHSTIMD